MSAYERERAVMKAYSVAERLVSAIAAASFTITSWATSSRREREREREKERKKEREECVIDCDRLIKKYS